MLPGVNPRQMQKMMKKMGISQQDLGARRVVIELEDKNLVFDNPSVQKVNMMGQDNFQISGPYREEERSKEVDISEEDLEVVVSQTGVDLDTARDAIKAANGDLAEAILNLQEAKEAKEN